MFIIRKTILYMLPYIIWLPCIYASSLPGRRMCSSMCEAILILLESKVLRVCKTGVNDRTYEVIDILPFDSLGSVSFPSRTHGELDIQFSSEVNSLHAPFWQVFLNYGYRLLTSMGRDLPENLTVLQPVKKYLAFNKTLRFSIAFIRAHHKSVPSNATSWSYILILSSHTMLRSS